MLHDGRMDLKETLGKFDPSLPVERASMPPAQWYTDARFYDEERHAVLLRAWQPVCRVAQIGGPGARMAGCFAGMPWVVVRDEDGELRAFENVCRHKGAEVVAAGAGQDARLRCQYHGWTYDLTGRLRSAPKMAGVQDFNPKAYGLRPLQVQAWGPWIFIRRGHGEDSLHTRLASLTEMLDRTDWEGLRWVKSTRWTLQCNWKVYVDNYLDGGYHIPVLHPSLDAQLDLDSYVTELYETFNVQRSAASTEPDGGRIGGGAIYAWLYPNFMVNRYGACLDSNWVVPLGPDRCEVHYDFFFDTTEGAEADKHIAESIAQSDVTQREDVAISEAVQRGLTSGAYTPGRYAPRLEHGEHQFHRLLHADLLRYVGDRSP